METDKACIAVDQESYSDIGSALRYFISTWIKDLKICMPATVLEYDRATSQAVVMPLIKHAYINKDSEIEYSEEESFTVPVRQVCMGGFSIDIPLNVGDTGWLISGDLDTSLLRQHGNIVCKVTERSQNRASVEKTFQQNPGSLGYHKFKYGFFMPDCWGLFNPEAIEKGVSVVSSDDLYIGESREGTVKANSNGTYSIGDKKDGLASITITRGEKEKRGKVTIAVGKECVFLVDGEEKKVQMSVDGACDVIVDKDKVSISAKDRVSISAPSLELPENTTVGGKSFSIQAFG